MKLTNTLMMIALLALATPARSELPDWGDDLRAVADTRTSLASGAGAAGSWPPAWLTTSAVLLPPTDRAPDAEPVPVLLVRNDADPVATCSRQRLTVAECNHYWNQRGLEVDHLRRTLQPAGTQEILERLRRLEERGSQDDSSGGALRIR